MVSTKPDHLSQVTEPTPEECSFNRLVALRIIPAIYVSTTLCSSLRCVAHHANAEYSNNLAILMTYHTVTPTFQYAVVYNRSTYRNVRRASPPYM